MGGFACKLLPCCARRRVVATIQEQRSACNEGNILFGANGFVSIPLVLVKMKQKYIVYQELVERAQEKM